MMLLGRGIVHRSLATSRIAYDRIAEETLQWLYDAFDKNVIEKLRVPDSDVTLASGVLTLRCGKGREIVINKQPPNEQLWFSSPISGPLRFDLCPEEGVKGWMYSRDKSVRLHLILEKDLFQMLDVPIDLDGK